MPLWSLPVKKGLPWRVQATKQATLALYRSLLRAATRFDVNEHKLYLTATIRERFRFHQYNTSPQAILRLLSDGNKARLALQAAHEKPAIMHYIDDLAFGRTGPMAHAISRLQQISHPVLRAIAATDVRSSTARERHPQRCHRLVLPTHLWVAAGIEGTLPTSRRAMQAALEALKQEKRAKLAKKRERRRVRMASKAHKPWQQTWRVLRNSSGYYVRIIRGFRVPTTAAMAIKRRVRKNEARLALFRVLVEGKNDLKGEALFYDQLKVPHDIDHYVAEHNRAIRDLQTKSIQTERFGESRKDKAYQTMARDPDDSSAIDANDKSAQGDSKTAIGTKKTLADKKTAHDKANGLAKGK